MDYVYMVKINLNLEDELNDCSFYGAFKSFRSASEWLIVGGFEPFYDVNLSEFLEDETIYFTCVDKESNEERHANIESYFIQN